MKCRQTRRLAASLAFSLVTTGVLAQQPPTTFSIYTVGAFAFQPLDPAAVYANTNTLDRMILSGDSCWAAPVNLPTGTVIDHIELRGCDNSDEPGVDVSAYLSSCYNGGGCVQDYHLTTAGAAGCGLFPSDSHYYRIENSQAAFVMNVCTPGAGSTNFLAVRVWYYLAVSEPPNAPAFLDVPTNNPYYQFVEALAAAGITSGCGAGNYCPDSPATRGQVAVFLAKALGLYWPR